MIRGREEEEKGKSLAHDSEKPNGYTSSRGKEGGKCNGQLGKHEKLTRR